MNQSVKKLSRKALPVLSFLAITAALPISALAQEPSGQGCGARGACKTSAVKTIPVLGKPTLAKPVYFKASATWANTGQAATGKVAVVSLRDGTVYFRQTFSGSYKRQHPALTSGEYYSTVGSYLRAGGVTIPDPDVSVSSQIYNFKPLDF